MQDDVLNTLPPGVYLDRKENRIPSLDLAPTAITGFMGLCERGPTDRAVEIRGVNDFYRMFGKPVPGGFLAPAVEGFFGNGGRVAYVIRISHKGHRPGEGDKPASLTLLDGRGKPTIKLLATSEGAWGNGLRVSVKRSKTRVSTLLTLDATKGATHARVSSTHGLRRGTMVKISSGKQKAYRYLIAIKGKELLWEESKPLKQTFRVDGPTHIEPVEFEIQVKYGNITERFQGLSMFRASPNYVARVINTQSALIKAIDLGSPSPLPLNLPQDADLQALSGGFEDILRITPEDFIGMASEGEEKRGLVALDSVEGIELILAPDLMFLYQRNNGRPAFPFSSLSDVRIVQEAMLDHCEVNKDRFALLDSPFPEDVERVQEWRQEFDSDHGAMYFPWITVNFQGKRILMPPSGHIAGMYAASDADTGVHKVPANMPLEFVSDLALDLWEEEIGRLNRGGVNCLKSLPGVGLSVWGGRTLSSDPLHKYINVRRTVSAVIRSVDSFMQWVVFEPNTRGLWKVITRQVGYFLTTLWRQGYLKGETPEQAFFVKCDDENNPPELRDQGILNVDIGLAPVKPAEYILFRMAQEMQEVTGE